MLVILAHLKEFPFKDDFLATNTMQKLSNIGCTSYDSESGDDKDDKMMFNTIENFKSSPEAASASKTALENDIHCVSGLLV